MADEQQRALDAIDSAAEAVAPTVQAQARFRQNAGRASLTNAFAGAAEVASAEPVDADESAPNPAPTGLADSRRNLSAGYRPPIPDEYKSAAEQLSSADPMLMRSVARLWHDPQFTDEQRRERIQAKIIAASRAPAPKPEPSPQPAPVQRDPNLVRQDVAMRRAAEVLASALGLDADDPQFLAAASLDDLRQLAQTRGSWVPRQHAEARVQALETALRARVDAGRSAPPSMQAGEGDVLPPRQPYKMETEVSAGTLQRRGLLATGFRQQAQYREQQRREAER